MNSGVQSKDLKDRSYRADVGSPNPRHFDGLAPAVWEGLTTPSIPQLVGVVFCGAPVEVRIQMLEHLMRPLGVLSLAAVAGGEFSKVRFRSGWRDLKICRDDVLTVKMEDVISLVEYVQQVDERVVDDLAALLQAWPLVREHEAAATLIQLLHQRSRQNSRGDTNGAEPVWH